MSTSTPVVPEWLLPGSEKRCQGNELCTATGPVAGVGLLCVGGPRAKSVGECRMCGRFFCGACATRSLEKIELTPTSLWAWRLGCPCCGLPLGDPLTSRAILHSSRSGACGGSEEQNGNRVLIGVDRNTIETLWRSHQLRGLGDLVNFYIAASHEGKIAVVERALNEAPGEPLVWLFKVVLCIDSKYFHAAKTAYSSVKMCGRDDPMTIALLGRSMNLDSFGNTIELKRNLDRFANETARQSKFNPALEAFHRRVQEFILGSGSLGSYVQTLFADKSPPDIVREYLRVVQVEMNLDTRGTEAERSSIIKVLVQKLSEDELKSFTARAMAMRIGSVSLTDFYADLEKLIGIHKIDLNPYPKLKNYFKYVADAASIDFATLHRQIWETEQAEYSVRCQTPEERATVLEFARLRVANRLLKHLEGKDPQGQLAATVAPNLDAARKITESQKQLQPQKPGLLSRIWRWFKK